MMIQPVMYNDEFFCTIECLRERYGVLAEPDSIAMSLDHDIPCFTCDVTLNEMYEMADDMDHAVPKPGEE